VRISFIAAKSGPDRVSVGGFADARQKVAHQGVSVLVSLAMPLVLQHRGLPAQMLFALKSLAGEATTEVRTAVAYTTLSGCATLFPELENRIGPGPWERIPKTVLTCFDFGFTEPAALEYLITVPGLVVRIANGGRPGGGTSFHPKLYLFNADCRRDFLVGSPNLTQRALTVNTEAAFVETSSGDTSAVDGQWDELLSGSVPLTPDLLREYTAARLVMPRPQNPDPPIPLDPAPEPRSLSSLEEAIAAGLEVASYDNFWVEAGSMSSGGSRNQLELPRGASAFFGFSFASYDDEHRPIGEVTLLTGSRRWEGRPLNWHGDNRMERINLPTLAQGGTEYGRMAVLFHRVAGGFELHVAPWDSALAATWRNASLASGRLFRIGGGTTPRICGLF